MEEPTRIELVIAVLQTAPLATWVRLPIKLFALIEQSRCSKLPVTYQSCSVHNPRIHTRWSGRRDSNSRYPAWEAGVLPLNYSREALQLYSREGLFVKSEYIG